MVCVQLGVRDVAVILLLCGRSTLQGAVVGGWWLGLAEGAQQLCCCRCCMMQVLCTGALNLSASYCAGSTGAVVSSCCVENASSRMPYASAVFHAVCSPYMTVLGLSAACLFTI